MKPTIRALGGLLAASHPLPTAAVTLLATGLALAWGRDPVGVALVAVTVLAGQLSIGWCDDAVDTGKDLAAGRTDKPIVTGRVDRRTVRVAAAVALVACVPLSFAHGATAGSIHLLVVAAGWLYAIALEATVWSWLPYAVAFGALPGFVHLGLPAGGLPPWWVPVAGALLGVGAHLANVLPDLPADVAAGVRGMPQRLGVRWVRMLTPVPPMVAVLVLVLAPPPPPPGVAWIGLVVAGLLTVASVVLAGRVTRLPFIATLTIAGLCVLLLLGSGGTR